ncbi:MAG: hypothetical protein Kow002_07540 [Anaerolineales bacterium]
MDTPPNEISEEQNKTRKWLWPAITGIVLICCCLIAIIMLLTNTENIPVIDSLFASATPTATFTPTATSTPTTTPTPKAILGITEPMKVEGVEIQLDAAHFEDSYSAFDKTWRPSKSGETLLIVEGTTNDKDVEIHTWKVKVIDNKGDEHMSSIRISKKAEKGKQFVWIFAVPETSHSFTLVLPDDQTIDITSIFER